MAVQTAIHGSRAGWLCALAFHLASYVHILLAAFGVTLLLRTVPQVLFILKLAGALYLIWMGVRLLRGMPNVPSDPADRSETRNRNAGQAFKDSLIVEVLNPKSALFYFAFLPQFTAAGGTVPLWLQIMLLGLVSNTLFSVTDIVCITASRLVAQRVSASARAVAWGQRAGGLVLIAMGVRVVTEKS